MHPLKASTDCVGNTLTWGRVTQVNIIILDPGGIVIKDFFTGETVYKPLTKRTVESLKLLCVHVEDVL